MTSTSKLFVLTSLAIGFSTAAMATPTYNPKTMSCAAVQQTIRDNGAVTLRYMSKRVKDLPLYDLYVRNSSYCEQGEEAVSASVPAADGGCAVNNCEIRSNDDQILLQSY